MFYKTLPNSLSNPELDILLEKAQFDHHGTDDLLEIHRLLRKAQGLNNHTYKSIVSDPAEDLPINLPGSTFKMTSTELAALVLHNYLIAHPEEAASFVSYKAPGNDRRSTNNRNCAITTSDESGMSVACETKRGQFNYCNYIKHESVQVKDGISAPVDLAELCDIVLNAKDNKKTIKAVGNGHSYSNISMTTGMIIRMCQLTDEDTGKQAEWNKSWFRNTPDIDPVKLVSVLGGTTIQELNQLLDAKKLAMSNLGGVDVQTVAGVLSTSTHGSGKDYGCLADFVRSMVLVNSGNDLVIRLEPANGITDPVNYTSPSYTTTSGKTFEIKLVQDDHLFYAALVSMGCMGVIYSVVLEVEDAFNLLEDRIFTDLDTVQSLFTIPLNDPRHFFNLRIPQAAEPPRHVEFYINPYKVKDSYHCILTRRFKIPYGEPSLEKRRQRGWMIAIDKSNLDPEIAYFLFTKFPRLVPVFLWGSLNLLEDNVGGKGDGYADKSFNVLNSGILKYILAGTGIEVCVPFNQAKDFLDKILNEIENLRDQNIYVNVPIGIRYIKASNAYLAIMRKKPGMTGGNDPVDDIYCTFEIPCILSKNHYDDYDKDIQALKILQELAMDEGANLHWGLSFKDKTTFNKSYLDKAYGSNLDEWLKAFTELNPEGVFNNEFTDFMGF